MPNKKAKKKPTKRTRGAPPLSAQTRLANKKFLMVVGVIVLVLAVYFGVKGLNAISEKRHLNWASQRLDYVQSSLNETMGNKVSMKRSNTCNYENQDYLNKGELRCYVSLSGTYTASNQEDAFIAQKNIINAFTSRSALNISPERYYADPAGQFNLSDKGLTCSIDTKIPTNGNQAERLKVSFYAYCRLKASQKFFPMNNNLWANN